LYETFDDLKAEGRSLEAESLKHLILKFESFIKHGSWVRGVVTALVL
jgi:hypothetical protein